MGPLYYNSKEPPKIVQVTIKAPILLKPMITYLFGLGPQKVYTGIADIGNGAGLTFNCPVWTYSRSPKVGNLKASILKSNV